MTPDEIGVTMEREIDRIVRKARDYANLSAESYGDLGGVIVALADRLAACDRIIAAKDRLHDAQHALILEQDADAAERRAQLNELLDLLEMSPSERAKRVRDVLARHGRGTP